MYQQPQQGPQQAGPMYQQGPMYGPPFERRNKVKTFAILALVFFLVGGLLHVFGLIPYLGIIFGCLGLFADLTGIVFLILVIVSL
jgi:hypothetical protein